MIDFTDKTVLITGGSRGIGAACVKAFSKLNAKVYFTYKSNISEAKKLEEYGKNIIGLQIDFMSDTLEADVFRLIEKSGGIDVLVNNAGIWNDGNMDTLTEAGWEELMKVNMTSSFLFTKAVLPAMKRKREGKIIFVSSTAGQRGEAFHSHYAASKGAQISFTKSLAVELAPFNINVNCAAPGWVLTELNNEVFADKEYFESVVNGIPLKRIATAQDVAEPVVFLASEMARHITGEVLNINGGSVLCG